MKLMTTNRPNNTSEPDTYSASGVDLTMLRWMASKSPIERLQILQANVNATVKIRNGKQRT